MSPNRFQGRYEILRNEEIAPEHYVMRVSAPEIAAAARPGQFLHVLVAPEPAPLLRRPISISRVDSSAGWVEMIYRVVGEGTGILSRTRPGVALDVMGPLGSPFRLAGTGRHILVGGGVGIPPMLFLAENLKRIRETDRALKYPSGGPSDDGIAVLLGGRTAGHILCNDDFAAIGITPQISTDDGSAGRHGLVTDILREALSDGAPATFYACGPIPMLRAVAHTAREFNRPCQVSFEARMGCGVGACLSCVIPTSAGYQRVCTEGPAFDAEAVDWSGDLDVM
ncbi:MAG TPA: dihydroorotate dehydrogenase electron transfer subunit [Armatimonadota bacterium]|jgi:dihydroorotate dehydrogenase electron transfer subunit